MNLSKEDQEFVKTYDDSKYAKPSVTADMVIFARGSEEEHLEVLLIQRGRPAVSRASMRCRAAL